MVWWLGLIMFTAVAWVQSLVREVRSHKFHDVAKKKKIIRIIKKKFQKERVEDIRKKLSYL